MHLRDRLRQILTINETPQKIAAAFAAGVFIGMSPLLGIHTILGLAVAWVFRLNRLVTLVGVYVTNPWTIVPIYTFGTWVGARLMNINDIIPDIDWNNITFLGFIDGFRPLVLPFVLGTTLIGFISAIIGYIIIYKAVKANRG
ncbi:MAG: DUF2062 domain-containing protein [Nitrospirota bacterium]